MIRLAMWTSHHYWGLRWETREEFFFQAMRRKNTNPRKERPQEEQSLFHLVVSIIMLHFFFLLASFETRFFFVFTEYKHSCSAVSQEFEKLFLHPNLVNTQE